MTIEIIRNNSKIGYSLIRQIEFIKSLFDEGNHYQNNGTTFIHWLIIQNDPHRIYRVSTGNCKAYSRRQIIFDGPRTDLWRKRN